MKDELLYLRCSPDNYSQSLSRLQGKKTRKLMIATHEAEGANANEEQQIEESPESENGGLLRIPNKGTVM